MKWALTAGLVLPWTSGCLALQAGPHNEPADKDQRLLDPIRRHPEGSRGSGLALDAEVQMASSCSRHASSAALADCQVCRLAPVSRPNLFIKESEEGLGSRFHSILYGMGVAAHHGMNLGGVISYIICGNRHFDRDHGQDIFKAVAAVLGLREPGELFTESPPAFDAEYRNLKEFEAEFSLKKWQDGGNILLKADFGGHLNVDVDHNHGTNISDYFGSRFFEALQRPGTPLAAMPVDFRPGGASVAVHVRRGDLFTTDKTGRQTPDDWYYLMVDKVRQLLPNADVHVFSSLKGRSKRGIFKPAHNSSEFDGYRERNMSVHLDGDVLEPWAHMSRADVVIMAKSSFSWIPAMLNTKCVIYQHWWLRPLSGWIFASDGAKRPETWKVDEGKLQKCVSRLQSQG